MSSEDRLLTGGSVWHSLVTNALWKPRSLHSLRHVYCHWIHRCIFARVIDKHLCCYLVSHPVCVEDTCELINMDHLEAVLEAVYQMCFLLSLCLCRGYRGTAGSSSSSSSSIPGRDALILVTLWAAWEGRGGRWFARRSSMVNVGRREFWRSFRKPLCLKHRVCLIV